MRLSEVALGSLIALGCAGCPGTIDDPAGFDALQQASQRDASTEGDDAGIDADVALQDAAPDSSEEDASTLQEGGPAPSEDASTGWDGSLRDAGDAAADAASGADTGIGCDFEALIYDNCRECHSAAPVSNTVDLMSPGLAQRLAGRRGTSFCSDYLLIDPDNPSQSALYIKVTPEKCGSRMPLGNTLTDGQQACILRWIESLK